jgi:hypothetical protein
MRLHSSAFAVGLFLLGTAPAAWAQPARPPGPAARSDLTGSLGWFNADKGDLLEYNRWYNRSLFAGVNFGWYWTDHLKTEIEAGASSSAEVDVYTNRVINNRQTFFESNFRFATRRIAIGQQYQFFRNAWFHPYVAAGVDFTWESIEQEDGPLSAFDLNGRGPAELQPAVIHPEKTEQHTRPFAGFGFKSYMTPRSFFRSDLKLVFHDGVDEALLRFGFGIDF